MHSLEKYQKECIRFAAKHLHIDKTKIIELMNLVQGDCFIIGNLANIEMSPGERVFIAYCLGMETLLMEIEENYDIIPKAIKLAADYFDSLPRSERTVSQVTTGAICTEHPTACKRNPFCCYPDCKDGCYITMPGQKNTPEVK